MPLTASVEDSPILWQLGYLRYYLLVCGDCQTSVDESNFVVSVYKPDDKNLDFSSSGNYQELVTACEPFPHLGKTLCDTYCSHYLVKLMDVKDPLLTISLDPHLPLSSKSPQIKFLVNTEVSCLYLGEKTAVEKYTGVFFG